MRRDEAKLNAKTMGENRVALEAEAARGVYIARPVATYGLDHLSLAKRTIRKGACSENKRVTTRVRGNAGNRETAGAIWTHTRCPVTSVIRVSRPRMGDGENEVLRVFHAERAQAP